MADKSISTGAALTWLESQIGGPCYTKESNPNASTVTAQLYENNGDRLASVIFNLGPNDVFIAFNAGVSSSNGIKIVANGGFASFTLRDDFTLPTFPLYFVSTIATSLCYVLESIAVVPTKVGP